MYWLRNNLSLFLILITTLFYISPIHAAEIILDNNSAGTQATGTWLRSSGANSYGTQSIYSLRAGATYSYTMPITEPGTYDVNLWWTTYPNRATQVAIDIKHRDGTARVYVNQQENGGQWNNIGSWDFSADAIVTIYAYAKGTSTAADAVQLISTNLGGNTNNAPTIIGSPATTVTVETAYSFIPSANDTDGDNLTFSISNKPRWANFNTNTGALTGTPASGDEETTQDIVISVNDGLQTTSLPAFNLTVAQENSGGSVVELVLDNNQPGTVATGNWLRSGGANSYGTQL